MLLNTSGRKATAWPVKQARLWIFEKPVRAAVPSWYQAQMLLADTLEALKRSSVFYLVAEWFDADVSVAPLLSPSHLMPSAFWFFHHEPSKRSHDLSAGTDFMNFGVFSDYTRAICWHYTWLSEWWGEKLRSDLWSSIWFFLHREAFYFMSVLRQCVLDL